MNWSSLKMGILYVVVGLVGVGLGLSQAVPALLSSLRGEAIDTTSMLPYLGGGLVLVMASGICLWIFTPKRDK